MENLRHLSSFLGEKTVFLFSIWKVMIHTYFGWQLARGKTAHNTYDTSLELFLGENYHFSEMSL
jgi:hypothetical protein